MANYSANRAQGLRQYSSVSEVSATVINEMIETIIQQAEAIQELDARLFTLEGKQN